MKTNLKWTIAWALLLAGCGGLPHALRQQIADENERLQQADKQIARAEKNIKEEFAAGAPTSPEWPGRFQDARVKLEQARNAAGELARLDKSHDRDATPRAERLLNEERRLRNAATDEADGVQASADRWLDFERNPQHAAAKMQSEYDAIRAVDLAPVKTAVARAEQDWPAKKPDLERRLTALQQTRQKAQVPFDSHAPIGTLIATEESLDAESTALPRDAADLTAKTGQLYNAWDKILEDLDTTNGVYREKVKTVKTHFIDVPNKKTEVASEVAWTDVSPVSYHAVENDLGMAIGHKDAGLYDSEAQSTAQPPGFAYIASPSVGSNQYGYWTQNERGSFWTFLPEYLIMRELLWGHSYRPIYVNEYNGYSSALRSGRTYYGRETPASPPRYGSHGTETEQRYAGSRYVQSGGYRSGTAQAPPSSSPRFSPAPEGSEGHRFGRGSESPSLGKRFGSGGGFPRSAPSGRRFGGGHRR